MRVSFYNVEPQLLNLSVKRDFSRVSLMFKTCSDSQMNLCVHPLIVAHLQLVTGLWWHRNILQHLGLLWCFSNLPSLVCHGLDQSTLPSVTSAFSPLLFPLSVTDSDGACWTSDLPERCVHLQQVARILIFNPYEYDQISWAVHFLRLEILLIQWTLGGTTSTYFLLLNLESLVDLSICPWLLNCR